MYILINNEKFKNDLKNSDLSIESSQILEDFFLHTQHAEIPGPAIKLSHEAAAVNNARSLTHLHHKGTSKNLRRFWKDV